MVADTAKAGDCEKSINPLTPMNDHDRISPYNINTILPR